MYSKDEILCYWFASSDGVGYGAYCKIKEKYDIEEFFASPALIEAFVARKDGVQNLIARANYDKLESEMFALLRRGISVLAIESPDYPEDLKNVYLPPVVLFVKGSLKGALKDMNFAVVGTRNATRNGMKNTVKICEELAGGGMCIVSGMATGIDTAAHTGALKTGTTVAVLGCGVDIAYPVSNTDLYHKIAEIGAVVSEFNPGTAAIPGNFPRRNRIITGLARGALVCEGSMKSGASISAGLALEQGKDVFALPGDISYPQSALPNSLINDGAKITLGSNTIFEYYGMIPGKNKKEIHTLHLDFFEQQIYNQLVTGSLTMDELAETIDFSASELAGYVTLMEIKNIIKRLPGGVISIM